jgi:hypothetical protein
MLIFILAAGYLFTVYLLLALAKRTGQKSTARNLPSATSVTHQSELSVTPNVTANVSEVVNSQ